MSGSESVRDRHKERERRSSGQRGGRAGWCRQRCRTRTRRAGRRQAAAPPSRSAITLERGCLPRTLCPVAACGAGLPQRGMVPCVVPRLGPEGGPLAPWSQDHAWSLPQDKGWDHRPSFTLKTWDHARGPSTTRGPTQTAAMGPRKRRRGSMGGPRKRRCGSARHGRWDHDGTPCRPTMRAVPLPPTG